MVWSNIGVILRRKIKLKLTHKKTYCLQSSHYERFIKIDVEHRNNDPQRDHRNNDPFHTIYVRSTNCFGSKYLIFQLIRCI